MHAVCYKTILHKLCHESDESSHTTIKWRPNLQAYMYTLIQNQRALAILSSWLIHGKSSSGSHLKFLTDESRLFCCPEICIQVDTDHSPANSSLDMFDVYTNHGRPDFDSQPLNDQENSAVSDKYLLMSTAFALSLFCYPVVTNTACSQHYFY